MYAIVKKRRQPEAEITTVDLPKIDGKQILVETKMASICGTDVHIWDWTEWAQNRIKKIPLTMGHEFAGKLAKT